MAVIDDLDKAYILSTLRGLIPEKPPSTTASTSSDPPDLVNELSRSGNEEDRQVVAGIQLWDWCTEPSVAAFLYAHQMPQLLRLTLCSGPREGRYCEVAVGALAAMACSLPEEAPELSTPDMQELVLGHLLLSGDPAVLCQVLRLLAALASCGPSQEGWLNAIWRTRLQDGDTPPDEPGAGSPASISALQYIVFVATQTLDEDVRQYALLTLLRIVEHHVPSRRYVAYELEIAASLQGLWADHKASSLRDTVLDLCEALLPEVPCRAVAASVLEDAEAEDRRCADQWD